MLSVEGELDLATAPDLRATVLDRADEGERRIVIDMTSVPFVDSSGLGAIVACLKHVRELGGDLVVVAPEGSPTRKLFVLTGLEDAIGHVATPAELPPT